MKDIVLGFSGGVDSAVCVNLLRGMGYTVHGLYLDNTDDKAKNDAVNAAEYLKMDLKVLDVKAELEDKVCAPFCDSYLRGETPIPCIICNPNLKFKKLCEYADSIGAEKIATGHYAIAKDGALYRAVSDNDQSYMLCRLTREQLSRAVFPLGTYKKEQTRQRAEGENLPVAKKHDSMDICFIPDKDYAAWMARRGISCPEGDIVFHGNTVARHSGILHYTVGQRLPFMLEGRRMYVSRIDAAKNIIEAAIWEELFTNTVYAKDFNWLIDAPQSEIRARVKVRHTRWEIPECTVSIENGLVKIVTDETLRAPARGQSAVLYDGDRVLGGGFIV